MACPLLLQLPVELLRTILSQLPSTAALAFILTCRSIYTACNDWTAWRDLVVTQLTLAHSYCTLLRRTTNQDTWKRYVVADALATRSKSLDSKDVERWLPHMVALHRTSSIHHLPCLGTRLLTICPAPADPVLRSTDILFLHRLCDAICNAPIVSSPDADPRIQAITPFPISPSRTADTHTWHLAQAASFCLSARLLAKSPPLGGDRPSCLLQTVQ
jgi:hypothetical protein